MLVQELYVRPRSSGDGQRGGFREEASLHRRRRARSSPRCWAGCGSSDGGSDQVSGTSAPVAAGVPGSDHQLWPGHDVRRSRPAVPPRWTRSRPRSCCTSGWKSRSSAIPTRPTSPSTAAPGSRALRAPTALPVISEEYPSPEVLLNVTPDLVTGNSDSYTFGPTTEGGTGFVRTDLASRASTPTPSCARARRPPTTSSSPGTRSSGGSSGRRQRPRPSSARFGPSLAATAAVLAGSQPIRTFFYEQGTGPLKTYGGGGQLDSGLKQSGGKGIFDDVPSFPTPTVSAEQVIERNPDVILVVDAGIFAVDAPPQRAKRTSWSTPSVPP